MTLMMMMTTTMRIEDDVVVETASGPANTSVSQTLTLLRGYNSSSGNDSSSRILEAVLERQQ
jgi:hypothetical protein